MKKKIILLRNDLISLNKFDSNLVGSQQYFVKWMSHCTLCRYNIDDY